MEHTPLYENKQKKGKQHSGDYYFVRQSVVDISWDTQFGNDTKQTLIFVKVVISYVQTQE